MWKAILLLLLLFLVASSFFFLCLASVALLWGLASVALLFLAYTCHQPSLFLSLVSCLPWYNKKACKVSRSLSLSFYLFPFCLCFCLPLASLFSVASLCSASRDTHGLFFSPPPPPPPPVMLSLLSRLPVLPFAQRLFPSPPSPPRNSSSSFVFLTTSPSPCQSHSPPPTP